MQLLAFPWHFQCRCIFLVCLRHFLEFSDFSCKISQHCEILGFSCRKIEIVPFLEEISAFGHFIQKKRLHSINESRMLHCTFEILNWNFGFPRPNLWCFRSIDWKMPFLATSFFYIFWLKHESPWNICWFWITLVSLSLISKTTTSTCWNCKRNIFTSNQHTCWKWNIFWMFCWNRLKV